jgi:DNA helicase II / ATP-dependent DNA helicase PcrA
MQQTEDHKADTAFFEAYGRLNAAQKEAVDAIEGPVMVIAGPGTGKTQILTLRIANILLRTQTRPENILALTFTESGAKAMRERLHMYIGSAAYKVGIFTFHAFAQRLISDHPDAYVRVIGGRPATDLEKVALIETILEGKDIQLLRPMGNPAYYVAPIMRTISELKKEYISPDTLASIVAQQEKELLAIEQFHVKGAHKGKVRGEYTKKESAIAKNKELLAIYRQYESLLRGAKLYDFEDMIVETVEALEKNENMLRDLQETYHYVLADEHQDVNGSQNRILELLCSYHDHPNIFVVGDEKQAIYRFQGASLENFLYFEDIFPHTKTIALTENYRSGQTILNAAHSLVSVEDGPLKELRVPLIAKAVPTSTVEERAFSHQAIEDETLVQKIKELLSLFPPQEIAVIVRTNKEVELFASLLRKEGIAIEASADGDILDHPITHAVMSFVDAVTQSHNESALFSLLHASFWGISPDDLIRIARARSYDQSLYRILASRELLSSLGVQHIEAALNVAATLTEARENGVTQSPHRILESLLRKSGFLEYVMKQDPIEGARVVRRIYDEIEEMVLQNSVATLEDVSRVFALHREHRLPLNAPYIANNKNAVQVLTAHKSKGLEFTAVFIPHAVDSVWGGASRRNYFDIPLTKHLKADEFQKEDDERRLLYVAMTRAKKMLYFSHAETTTDGRELIASRLLEDIDETHKTHVMVDKEEQLFDPLSALTKSAPNPPVDAALFAAHLQERGLSATALNNYLRSPWDYVYRNVLRIPEVQTLPLQFGTALHGVMEWVSGVYASTKTMPTPTQVKTALESQLARLPLTNAEFTQLHEKGFAALLAFVQHMGASMPQESKVEFALHVSLPTGLPEFPEVTLTGKLDRLDFDPEGRVVQVVDYKTGKPKTRNEIEGKTKSSNGDYKRQLTFYALLLSLYDDERYACKTGRLSFVEPDAKGVIHEELFLITTEEIEALKAEIIAVVRSLISGDFLLQPCSPDDTEYYQLAQYLIGQK